VAPPRLEIRTLDDTEVVPVDQVLGLARLHRGSDHYFVAWFADELAGHAYRTLTIPPEPQDVEGRKEFRRRGVARLLVGAAGAPAIERGTRALRLSISAHNESVLAPCRSLGFGDTGLAPVTVRGTTQIRTGPLDVDDVLLAWDKVLVTSKCVRFTSVSSGT
jgi:GNAT superfamily N-acetyltransferase